MQLAIRKSNQILSNFNSKGLERSVYWNDYKTKSENKNTINEYRRFFKSKFVGVNRLFFLVYSNQYSKSKSYKIGSITYQKVC